MDAVDTVSVVAQFYKIVVNPKPARTKEAIPILKRTENVDERGTVENITRFRVCTHMRKLMIDQNPTENPHPAVANTHTERPKPIRRKGGSL